MTDIVKGILDGGWAFLVGWLFPSALNVLLFGFLVYPSIQNEAPFDKLSSVTAIVTAAAVLGIILSALQTPLYRILEGYTWPSWAYDWGKERQRERRLRLKHSVNFAGYSEAKQQLKMAEYHLSITKAAGNLAKYKAAEEDVARAAEKVSRWQAHGMEAQQWLLQMSKHSTKAERRVARIARLPRLRRLILAEQLDRYP